MECGHPTDGPLRSYDDLLRGNVEKMAATGELPRADARKVLSELDRLDSLRRRAATDASARRELITELTAQLDRNREFRARFPDPAPLLDNEDAEIQRELRALSGVERVRGI